MISLCLALVPCLGLTVPVFAAAEDQKIVGGGQTYQQVVSALMAQTEGQPVTLRLDTDIQLTNFCVVLGSSDYGGILNGNTLTGEKDYAVFEVQSGYTLTIIDSSEAKTGKLVS